MPWRGPEEPGEYPTLGWLALDWIEDNLRLTDGPHAGEPFRLYDEQAQHVLQRYRLDPEATEDDGNDAFQYGGSQFIRGQKWGKDPVLAALDVFHAFGPCDYAGWDANGEPVGRPHPSPWIFVAALNVSQADNTWLPVKAMVTNSDLVDLPGVEVTQDLIRLPSGNPMEKLTTTAFGRLGGRFTSGSLTENGLMTASGENGNTGPRSPLAFARTLLRSVGGMQGMWQGASNTWDPTELSHAQQLYEAKDPHILMDAKLSRGRVELHDDEALREELLYLYGDSVRERGGHISTQRLMREVRSSAGGETEARRFFLSEILAGERPLATPERWDALARPVVGEEPDPLKPGEAITLGFDGSRKRDTTVLTAVRIRDGRAFHLRTWEPLKHPDKKVPRPEVDQAVADAFAAYEVWYLFADPYLWQDYVDLWTARYQITKRAPGDVRPTDRVFEQPTNVDIRMDDMLERLLTAIATGEFTHDGDPVLRQHVMNTAVAKGRRRAKPRFDENGKAIEHYLKLVKKREDEHIDGSISVLLAYAARGRAVEDGALTHETKPPPPARSSLGAPDSAELARAGGPTSYRSNRPGQGRPW